MAIKAKTTTRGLTLPDAFARIERGYITERDAHATLRIYANKKAFKDKLGSIQDIDIELENYDKKKNTYKQFYDAAMVDSRLQNQVED